MSAEEREELARVEYEIHPGSVESSLDAVEAMARKLLEGSESVGGLDPEDPDSMRWLKAARAEWNRMRKELGKARREGVAEYMRPINGFVEQVKAVEDMLKLADADARAKLDESERIRLDKRRAKLQEAYEEFAPLLAEVVPLEKVLPQGWHLRSTGEVKAVAGMQERVSKVAGDWDALKLSVPPAYLQTAERDFFDLLDLSHAVVTARNAEIRDQQLASMKAEVERTFPGCEALPPNEDGEPVRAPEPEEEGPEPDPQDQPRDWVVEVNGATRRQMCEVAEALATLGLKGRVRRP